MLAAKGAVGRLCGLVLHRHMTKYVGITHKRIQICRLLLDHGYSGYLSPARHPFRAKDCLSEHAAEESCICDFLLATCETSVSQRRGERPKSFAMMPPAHGHAIYSTYLMPRPSVSDVASWSSGLRLGIIRRACCRWTTPMTMKGNWYLVGDAEGNSFRRERLDIYSFLKIYMSFHPA